MSDLDAFLCGYATAILWASAYRYTANGLEPDESAAHAYITPGKWWEDTGMGIDDARAFYAEHVDTMRATGEADFGQHGHDFALTRNRHGSGFWDRGYGAVGDALTDAAQAYGEHSVLTDDGPTVTDLD